MDAKTCSCCGTTKSLSDFYVWKGSPVAMCKSCTRQKRKAYREQNRDRIAIQKRESSIRNKDKIAKYQKAWRLANAERLRAWNREYHQKHPPKKRTPEQNRRYYRAYHRSIHLQKKFGITEADYDAMIVSQNGKCAICGTTNPRGKGHTRFHVDHCHQTGVVRGLLCSRCNLGLGAFLDDIAILQKAIEYLSVKGKKNVG